MKGLRLYLFMSGILSLYNHLFRSSDDIVGFEHGLGMTCKCVRLTVFLFSWSFTCNGVWIITFHGLDSKSYTKIWCVFSKRAKIEWDHIFWKWIMRMVFFCWSDYRQWSRMVKRYWNNCCLTSVILWLPTLDISWIILHDLVKCSCFSWWA